MENNRFILLSQQRVIDTSSYIREIVDSESGVVYLMSKLLYNNTCTMSAPSPLLNTRGEVVVLDNKTITMLKAMLENGKGLVLTSADRGEYTLLDKFKQKGEYKDLTKALEEWYENRMK